MQTLKWFLAAAVLAASCGLAVAAATDKPADTKAAKPADKSDTVVVKVLETPKEGAPLLKVAPPVGQGTFAIAIPAMNDPDPVLKDLLLNVRPGNLLEVKTTMVGGKCTLVSASAYTAKLGEEEPNVYIFVKRTTYRLSGSDVPALEVTKFLKTTTFVLPFTKDKDGKITPNADMAHTLEGFKEGDSLEAVPQGSSIKLNVFTLKTLKAYVPWEKAMFSKLSKQKYQGEDYTALEVLDDGENLAMLMKEKDVLAVTDVVTKIKHGEPLLYRAKTVDDTTWVTEVKRVLPEAKTGTTDTGNPKRIVDIPPAKPKWPGRKRH